MGMEADRREAAQKASEKYSTMAADLSLVHVNANSSNEQIHDHISKLARNIQEQATQLVRTGPEHDLADVWKTDAFEATQMHLGLMRSEDLRRSSRSALD